MSETTQTGTQRSPRFSLDTWAVAASVVFIALIVAGIFPRVPW
jgi:hypothetical protein